MNLLATPLGRFRIVALLEGVSYVALVFLCMPLKYWAEIEWPVKVTGWAHGVLFMLYIALLVYVHFANNWSVVKSFFAFIASLIPFGTFVLEWYLRRDETS